MANHVENPSDAVVTRQVTIPGGNVNLLTFAQRYAAMAKKAGHPVRMRLQPALFIEGQNAKYVSWPGVSWKMEFSSEEDLVAFQRDMQAWMAEWFRTRQVAAESVATATGQG